MYGIAYDKITWKGVLHNNYFLQLIVMEQAYIFLMYPKCSTCQKAKRFLDEHHIHYIQRHIVENPPTVEELREWLNTSDISVNKLWNTSGVKYRTLKLKERISSMSLDEALQLLADDGMLIKRPLLITNHNMLVGFKPNEWESLIDETA